MDPSSPQASNLGSRLPGSMLGAAEDPRAGFVASLALSSPLSSQARLSSPLRRRSTP
ncbi:hypothetical protein EI42_04101 [Thermosporothrix hazakensis]|uniref:Uncharacterized protein n=1 Tax=Thermosporothrix hazakensis TaxID=644383 RepID=A0A326U2Z0_THEHA|nr:hypothetical protein EI42_04101 [Thermosporothrix hazakensis]